MAFNKAKLALDLENAFKISQSDHLNNLKEEWQRQLQTQFLLIIEVQQSIL